MPRVWNRRDKLTPKDAVYVGRPTKWGNPYSHLPDTLASWQCATRDEAVGAYAAWLADQPALVAAAKMELRGKHLVCWCAPRSCHADILLAVANEP